MPEHTQKQIASKYKGDLTYYKKTHPMRRLRFWLCVVAFFGGLVWALGFHKLGGSPQFFNTGPISQNHSHFQNQCAVCHTGASVDMLSILPIDEARKTMLDRKTPILETLQAAGSKAYDVAKENLTDPQKLADSMSAALGALNLDNINRACLVCHDGMSLHQPGEKAVMFRETVKELSVVGAGACSSCHKEHISSARMKLPTSETCTDCHGDAKKLQASLTSAKYAGKLSAVHSQNWKHGKIVQWIPPAPEHTEPKVIRAFADKDPAFSHPPFLYEKSGSKDNAKILFNHARHVGPIDPKSGERTQAKGINLLNGQALDCRTCHTPSPDGVGMLRIEYSQHCQACHSLGVDPKMPELTIPHRDPEKVRAFLVSLRAQWMDLAKSRYDIKDAAVLDAFWRQREAEFIQDWPQGKTPLETFDLWQDRVFYVGIPPKEQAPNGQRLPACNKCHTVEKGGTVPKVVAPLIPDQWLTRGPYKHAPHMHLNCLDCHRAAEKSKDTADISLPSHTLCAECHRERDYTLVSINPAKESAPTFGEFGPAAAAKQRKEGGVFSSCLDCHKYHVKAAEMDIGRSLKR